MAKKSNRYINYSSTTQDFMKTVDKFIVEKYGKIESHWIGQLDLLAANFEIFQQSKKHIEDDGLMITNRFGGFEKHPLLGQMKDSTIQCLKIINEFGLSPKSIGKIKVDDNDDNEFLDSLLNG